MWRQKIPILTEDCLQGVVEYALIECRREGRQCYDDAVCIMALGNAPKLASI